MRGKDESSGSLFSHIDLEVPVPEDHPLKAIRELTKGLSAISDISDRSSCASGPNIQDVGCSAGRGIARTTLT